eukprot:symbB.v1.2.032309.t1/scaffold3865.1/size49057/2
MRHPKFNALRFIYMWLTLAIHHATSCDFWMKADMDAYVDVPKLQTTLRSLNASEKVYAGYEEWTTFAHGIGYVISRAALKAAVPGLKKCMYHLLKFRLEAIEDMLLASCFRTVKIKPVELGHMIYNFQSGQEKRVVEERPLITHRVEDDDMYRLHAAMDNLDESNPKKTNRLQVTRWTQWTLRSCLKLPNSAKMHQSILLKRSYSH